MRRSGFVLLGLILANPSWAKEYPPCPAGTRIPVSFRVASPVCPGVPLNLVAEACGPCVDLIGGMTAPLRVQATMDLSNCILRVCEPDSLTIPIGTFAAGHHFLLVQVSGTVLHADSTQTCTVVQYDSVLFDVPQSCGPQPGPLPYTDVIRIGYPPPCDSCPPPPICWGDSIPFHIAGMLPNACYEFRGLELLPSDIAGPLPQPPIARVTIARDECSGTACPAVMVPWDANALLPPLPGGTYHMMVQLKDVIECDSFPPLDTLHTTLVPFQVEANCGPPPTTGCFLYGWRGNSADSGCAARVGPGTPGRVLFEVTPFTPLAGLQGRLTLDPAALQIAGLRAVGPAADMHLTWQRHANGASFVLFADHGAPIFSPAPCSTCPPSPVPVLEVMLAEQPSVPIPPLTWLDVVNLVASDSAGGSVPVCPTFAVIPPAPICGGHSCDFNGDGHVDVRDLVLMVRCIRNPSTCPDSADGRFDCSGDGRLGLDDVLCCAREIIHHRIPDGAITRLAPGLRVSTGSPVITATGVEIPVQVARADLVGAARLAFSFAADRFSGVDVYLPGDDGSWFVLSEATGGELIVGLIANAPIAEGSGLDLVLRFTLADGQQPSNVALTTSDFAATDGVALAMVEQHTSVPLPDAARIRLSAAGPNPFSRETRLVLTLAQAAEADLTIYDLSGRRITTLHRGPLTPGSHPFRWDGTLPGGARARDGIYLLRAEAEGASATLKLVLLQGR